MGRPLIRRMSRGRTRREGPFILPRPTKSGSCLVSCLGRREKVDEAIVSLFLGSKLVCRDERCRGIIFGKGSGGKIAEFTDVQKIFSGRNGPFGYSIAKGSGGCKFGMMGRGDARLMMFRTTVSLVDCISVFASCRSGGLTLKVLTSTPLRAFLQRRPRVASVQFYLSKSRPKEGTTTRLVEGCCRLNCRMRSYPPPTKCGSCGR